MGPSWAHPECSCLISARKTLLVMVYSWDTSVWSDAKLHSPTPRMWMCTTSKIHCNTEKVWKHRDRQLSLTNPFVQHPTTYNSMTKSKGCEKLYAIKINHPSWLHKYGMAAICSLQYFRTVDCKKWGNRGIQNEKLARKSP